MEYVNKVIHGVDLLRQWLAENVDQIGPGKAHREVSVAVERLLSDFRLRHDVPHTRYWYHPESESYLSSAPFQPVDTYMDEVCLPLTRAEFLGRQKYHSDQDIDDEL